jgi:hypothetical protein
LRKKANIMESSASSDAEVSQDSVLSENIITEQPTEEDPKRTTPTSPLLTHLLKSPASTSQVAFTALRGCIHSHSIAALHLALCHHVSPTGSLFTNHHQFAGLVHSDQGVSA